jgi:hypothetical protein
LDDQRRADLSKYLSHLAAGGKHDALQAEALGDLSFADLRMVIASYVNAAKLDDSYGFQELLLSNSDQYIRSKELLKVYAPDFLSWLLEAAPERGGFLRILAASDRKPRAADVAVRLLPEDSLVFIYEQKGPFRKALLQAWARRLARSQADPPIQRGAMQAVLRLDDDSEDFLRFKGYWRSVSDNLRRLLESDSREVIMQALRVQALHPAACKQNPMLIRKWSDDSEIVIQALKNIGNDRTRDHAKALSELWPSLPDGGERRYWCLHAMGTHATGNEAIALGAIQDGGHRYLEPALAVLRDSSEAQQGIRWMLDHHKTGYSELFQHAAKYQIPGFEADALAILQERPEPALIRFLGQSGGDVGIKLLQFLEHPNQDVRLEAISAFLNLKAHRASIAPRLIQVIRTDPVLANRQRALWVLGQWRAAELASVFRELLTELEPEDFGLLCWTGLAGLDAAGALDELARSHASGTARQRMEALLAYQGIGLCPEFAFEDLKSDVPKLVATAAALIREHGTATQRKRLAVIQARRYWYHFSHSGLDQHGIVSHAGHGHAH